jgi:ATP-binding cassette subfamily C protein
MRVILALLRTMSRRQRLTMLMLTALLLVGSLMEIVGVGIILPLVYFVQQPSRLATNEYVGPLLRFLGVEDPTAAIIVLAVLVVGIFILKNGVLAFQHFMITRHMAALATDFSTTLLRNYAQLPYLEFIQTQNSTLIRNMTAEITITCNALRNLFQFVAEVFITVGLIAMLWYAETAAAVIATMVMVAFGGLTTRAVRRRLRAVAKIRLHEEAERLRWIRRAFGGFKEIRVLGREGQFVALFRQSTRRMNKALARGQLMHTIPPLLLEVVAVTALITFLVTMLSMGRDATSIFGVMALFGVAAIRLIPATKKIVTGINVFRFNLPSMEVVATELARSRGGSPVRRPRGQLGLSRAIELENVSFTYPGIEQPAVSRLNLTIRRGEKIGIVGPSGAGKTTLVDIILGLLVPTEGRIAVDGRDIQDDVRAWQSTIGYIPQAIYLSDDTLRRNVAFGVPDDEIDDARVWAVLEAAQLGDFIADLPEQLDTWAGERGIRLSGGQRQRIGIARALYHNPQLIVLDEATSALDTETERLLEEAIRALARDKTLLVIAHRISTIRNADRICVMSEGRIEGVGSFEELRLTSPLFQRLLESSEIVPIRS